jgi:hypothetical protein
MRQGQLRGGPRGGKQVIATLPEIRLSVRAQRAFPGRAVHYLATSITTHSARIEWVPEQTAEGGYTR